ncbi:MAG: serine/threonine protein kinase [Deltaproteobacteria bacterium]|nr:serine/threonine protein kinase [Deltaproteobacteria bacterium]
MEFPSQFGKYLLLEKIARGGMAEIFLAKQKGEQGFEKELVIKKILPEWANNPSFLTMLIDEAKLAALLTHPNIVQVHDLGREGNDYFIAMEYIPGVDLRRLWEKVGSSGGKIPLPVILFIMTHVLDGLQYAHSKKDPHGKNLQIIHRDVSPQNILVSYDGTVKLTDFGIAKAALRTTETVSGVHKGKFAYMSPEQANLQEIGQSSDLFSAGIVLYEVLTGRRLFGGGSDIETLDRIRKIKVHFTPEDEKHIPPRLREIVRKALARSPEDRFPQAAAFREEISRFAVQNGFTLQREGLVDFLESVFGVEGTPQPASLEAEVKTSSLLSQKPSSRKAVAVVLTLAALGLLLFFGIRSRMLHPAVSSNTAPVKPALPAAMPASPQLQRGEQGGPASPTSQGGPVLKTEGFLTVLAIPWGYVSIDRGPNQTSPLQKRRLAAGSHHVRIFYEPDNLTLETDLEIRPEGNHRCLANLQDDPPSLHCR